MKQISLIITVLVIVASSKDSRAQTINDVALNHSTAVTLKPVSPYKKELSAEVTYFMRCSKILSEIMATKVNIRAIRDFTRSYKNIPDAKWFKTEGGFIANFLSKGIYTKVVYDERGRWLYNLLQYTEANLTFDIRDIVKRNYYDHDIFSVDQFDFFNKTVYLIKTQDQQSKIVTLKICDGVMEDITLREKE